MRHRLPRLNFVKSAALALLFLSNVAHAALISGAGTWSAATPTTAFSQPNASWSFSFNLPDQIAANPTVEASNVSYFLNGQLVSTTLQGVRFYPAAADGLFDLIFGNTSIVTLYGGANGPDVGSTLQLAYGTFDAHIAMNGGFSSDNGTGTVTLSAVPEPGTYAMLGLGLGLIGLVARRKRA